MLLGDVGNWYVDAATGAVGQARLRAPEPQIAKPLKGRKRAPIPLPALQSDQIIIERTATPVLKMTKRYGPDELGSLALLDTLTLDFDYAGEHGGRGIAESDDERQFVRVSSKRGHEFVRRDPAAEAKFAQVLADFGFVQLRIEDGSSGKGRRVHVLRGPDSAELWHRFLTERMPLLEDQGWRCSVDSGFGPPRRKGGRRLRRPHQRRRARQLLARPRHRGGRRPRGPPPHPDPPDGTRPGRAAHPGRRIGHQPG